MRRKVATTDEATFKRVIKGKTEEIRGQEKSWEAISKVVGTGKLMFYMAILEETKHVLEETD